LARLVAITKKSPSSINRQKVGAAWHTRVPIYTESCDFLISGLWAE
jgi:hypothetical protein